MILPFLPGALVAFSINGFEKPNLSSVCLCYSNVISSRQRTELQSICMCDPIDGSPPGSPVPGILWARTLEWVAIFFSSAWKWKVKVKSLSCVWPSVTPWTAAFQAPPSMGFSRQECWSGVPLPSPYSSLVVYKVGPRPAVLISPGNLETQNFRFLLQPTESETWSEAQYSALQGAF